ncbi:MAG: metallophosphoesterase [Bdellovibrionales bacterium]
MKFWGNKNIHDFSKADYTAIISDLHLCEAEPPNKKHPLWKKYKTREFFFDDMFEDFLEKLHARTGGKQIELILNGDIFDFDSVTAKPPAPPFRVSWVESLTGLKPQEEKSTFKIKRILSHHEQWVRALRDFLKKGHRVIFIIGNHDLELHWPKVQSAIVEALAAEEEFKKNIRFNEWFYISNADTLIEHGNQYDPYCLAEDPVNPIIQRWNRLEIRVPFGNLATRYLINRMGFLIPM